MAKLAGLAKLESGDESYKWLCGILGGADPVQFQNADMEKLPKYNGELTQSFLENSGSWKETLEGSQSQWTKSKSILSCNALALFVATSCNGRKLSACHADVNGKRFAKISASRMGEACIVQAVPYKIDHTLTPSKDGSLNGLCEVVPMIYDDAKDGASSKGYASPIVLGDVLGAFTALFGGQPDDQQQGCSQLMVLLLNYINHSFELETPEGWEKLMLAMGRHIWGEKCVDSLNALAVDKDSRVPFTLFVFSSIVPVFLGFLTGESYVCKTHSMLCQNGEEGNLTGYGCNLSVLEIAREENQPAFPHTNLKAISNALLKTHSDSYLPGSWNDFIQEFLVEQIKKKGGIFWNTKEYFQDHDSKCKTALQRFLQWSKHNPHLKIIRNAYEEDLAKTEGVDRNTVSLENQDRQTAVLNKLIRAKHLVKDVHKKCPKYLFFVISILLDFDDQASAKALSDFLNSSIGVSLRVFCSKIVWIPDCSQYFGPVARKPSFLLGS